MTAEIELWTWPTPNGRKASIMLEECGLPYRAHGVNIRTGEQLTPDFLKLNPNNKVPVIIDPDGPGGAPLKLFESGAILEYLAEKTGRFLPEDPAERWMAKQWLMFQMGGIGPMHGQANHFCTYASDEHPYSRDRYRNEAIRLYRVVDEHLADRDWFAGDDCSIADIAVYPWTQQIDRMKAEIEDFPNLARWAARMGERPGVVRGMAVLADRTSSAQMTDDERRVMFGDLQYRRAC